MPRWGADALVGGTDAELVGELVGWPNMYQWFCLVGWFAGCGCTWKVKGIGRHRAIWHCGATDLERCGASDGGTDRGMSQLAIFVMRA